MDVSADRIKTISWLVEACAGRADVPGQVCGLMLLAGSLYTGLAAAAFPTGTQVADDIGSLRTPWYYIYGDPQGAACLDSEQAAIDVILDYYRSWPSTCEIIDHGVSGWPTDPDAGSQLAPGYCANEASQDLGPLPDATDQNAKPHYWQLTSMLWTRVYSGSSDCPNDLGQYDDSRSLSRYSFDYCPDGYAFYYSQDAGAPSFCRRGSTPERDQEALCGVGGGGSSLAVGNPIFIGTGKKYQKETDYTDARDPAFVLTRHYDSLVANYPGNAGIGLFGAGWTSTYERQIDNADAGASATRVVRRPSGHRYYFNSVDGNWVSNSNVRETLLQTAEGWSYTTTEDVVEHYNATGKLLSLAYPDGRQHSLSYDGQGRLLQVVTTTGESLDFSYRSGTSRELVEYVTDHAGRSWKYIYSPDDILQFVVYPDGTTGTDADNPLRQYHYENPDFPAALTGITDERGIRYASYGYDNKGRAVYSYHGSAEDAIGRIDIDYNGSDDYSDGEARRTLTNSKGISSAYTTILQQGVALLGEVSGPGCASCGARNASYSYAAGSGLLLSRTDNGVTTGFGNHDANGNPGFRIEAQGTVDERRTDYTYDPRYFRKISSISQPSVFAGARKLTTYGYDNFGNRTSETITGFTPGGEPVSQATVWQYDGPLHQLSLIDGPRTDISDTTVYRYYPDDSAEGVNRARLREVENAAGILTRSNIQYTPTGKVQSETRPNGLQIVYRYYPGTDRLETITSTAPSGIQVTRWRYLATGEVESITAADGTPDAVTVTFDYDAARRLVSISDGLGNRIDYQLDSEGNRTGEMIYDSAGILRNALTRTFDAYNREAARSQANEQVRTDYAPDGVLQQATDGVGSKTAYSYDALKRLLGRTRDLGGVNAYTGYSYDVSDQLRSVIDPVGGETTYLYDDLGNLLEAVSPDTGMTRYSHDGSGNTVSMLDAKGQLFSYSYDSLNRLTVLDAAGTAEDIYLTYDDCAAGQGRLCSLTMGSSTVNYSFDPFGNTTAHQAVVYDYDTANRIRTINYPSGSVVSYSYDTAGQLSRVALAGNGMDTVLAEQIRYLPFGGIEFVRYGNGAALNQQSDTAYRIADQSVAGSLQMAYSQYDGNGNLLTRVDSFSGSSHYSYDALGRLDAATGPFGDKGYGYDLNGNRLTLDDGVVTSYEYSAESNRLVSESGWQYTLDANGNTVARTDAGGAGRYYTYNSHNRLLTAVERSVMPVKGKKKPPKVIDTLLGSYSYNGLGQRVSKDANSTVSQFIYGLDGKLMAEEDETGVATRDYVYIDNQLLAVLDYITTQNTGSEEVIMDNGLPPAGWSSKTSQKDYGIDYLYSPGDSGSSIRWTPVLEAGDYEVYVWYVRNRKNSNNVPYMIMHDSRSDLVVVDQTSGGGSWQLLGNFSFDGTGSEHVEVSDSTGGTSADAVKFLRVNGGSGTVSTTISYVHNDHLGTPQVMTDESGNVVWRAEYDPFGDAVIDASSSQLLNVRFPGQYFDTETGLHYNYFRTYDPETGRYITSDPISLKGGLNTYAYGSGNPLNLYDPYGLDVEVGVRPFYPAKLPYARHCFARFNGNNNDTLSFDNKGVHSDPNPGGGNFSPTTGQQNDTCVRREMNRCDADDYDFTQYNCCHCLSNALNSCGLSNQGPWPNWPFDASMPPFFPPAPFSTIGPYVFPTLNAL